MAKKTTKVEPLFVKSKVQEYIKSKGLNTSGEIVDGSALNDLIISLLDKAIARAKAGQRKTIQEKDL